MLTARTVYLVELERTKISKEMLLAFPVLQANSIPGLVLLEAKRIAQEYVRWVLRRTHTHRPSLATTVLAREDPTDVFVLQDFSQKSRAVRTTMGGGANNAQKANTEHLLLPQCRFWEIVIVRSPVVVPHPELGVEDPKEIFQ